MELQGRRALVTGAGIRVGKVISEALAARGVHLALHYRSSGEETERLARALRERGLQAQCFEADFDVPGEAERLTEEVEADFGPLDVLVLSAAVYPRERIANIDRQGFARTLQANLTAPFFLARDIGLRMKERGRGDIITLLDWSVGRPDPMYLPYQISKAGLQEATLGLAQALAPEVSVNGVAPGAVLLPNGTSKEKRARIVAQTPLGRIGSPEEVARAVVYLLDARSFTTGTIVKVDGGRSLR